jgi:hypothetical protein
MFLNFLSRWQSSRQFKTEKPLLFWKALFGLAAFDVFGFRGDFVRMHRLVRNWKVAPKRLQGISPEQVCNAVNHACAWYPRRVQCLQRSAITTCLMRHCGITAAMALGAQLRPFRAHAWTELDGLVVNERRDAQKHYVILERF